MRDEYHYDHSKATTGWPAVMIARRAGSNPNAVAWEYRGKPASAAGDCGNAVAGSKP